MRARVLMVLMAALVLAGCAASPSTSGTSPDDAESPSLNPSSNSPATDVSSTEAVVTTEGYGAVAIGLPVAAGSAAEALIVWKDDACGGGAGAWIEAGLDPAIDATFVQDGVHFVVDSTGSRTDPISSIVVFSGLGPATDRGIAVGSSEAELRNAYPQPDAAIDLGGNGALYVVSGLAGRLQFTLNNGKVSSFGVTAGAADNEQTRLGASDWYFPCA